MMTYITSQATKSATNSPILFHINFEISIDAEIIPQIQLFHTLNYQVNTKRVSLTVAFTYIKVLD